MHLFLRFVSLFKLAGFPFWYLVVEDSEMFADLFIVTITKPADFFFWLSIFWQLGTSFLKTV